MADWPKSAPPPEYIYLITTRTEWPVDVVLDGSHAATHVAAVIDRRLTSGNVSGLGDVQVFRARLTDLEEVEYSPPRTTAPELRLKTVGSYTGRDG